MEGIPGMGELFQKHRGKKGTPLLGGMERPRYFNIQALAHSFFLYTLTCGAEVVSASSEYQL
jgi:hypothetical protein